MIDSGVNLNGRDCEGATALFWAVWGGHEPVAAVLLKRGADPNLCTYTGYYPLHICAYRGYVGIARLLLHYRAHLEVKNSFGEMPVHYSTSNFRILYVDSHYNRSRHTATLTAT
jgi:ankyrin repeat protein